MADLKLEGVGVALVTPFHDDLSIDFEGLELLIKHVTEGGADYIVALGTTAESPTLSLEEKYIIADFIKQKNCGKLPIVIGIGGNNTIQVAKDINSWNLDGFSAILSVTPFYNKPSQEGLYRHYQAISEISPLPIILYNVPGRTGVNLSPKTTLRLAKDFSNIIGIKEASGKISQSEEIINNIDRQFHVISGDDASTFEIMKKGGKGVISVIANALPQKIKKLVSLCEKGNYDEAKQIQSFLDPLIKHLFEEGNPAGVKAVLSKLGIIKNELRLPLVKVSQSLETKLQEELYKLEEL